MSGVLRLKSVATSSPAILELEWTNGEITRADMSDVIARSVAMSSLEDEAIFALAEIDDWGYSVSWPNDVGVTASFLRDLSTKES